MVLDGTLFVSSTGPTSIAPAGTEWRVPRATHRSNNIYVSMCKMFKQLVPFLKKTIPPYIVRPIGNLTRVSTASRAMVDNGVCCRDTRIIPYVRTGSSSLTFQSKYIIRPVLERGEGSVVANVAVWWISRRSTGASSSG